MDTILGALRGVLIAAALAMPILAGADVPNGFWVSHHEALFASVIAGVVAAGWDPILRELGQGKRRHRIRNEYYFRWHLAALLVSLVEITGTDWKETGVYFYQLQWRLIPGLRRLTRLCELRLQRIETDMTEVRWTFRRGVVGKCWAENKTIVTNWADVNVRLSANVQSISADKGISSKRAWRKIPKGDRWGLTYRQFCDSGAYQRIAGYPVKNENGTLIGVLSIDGPIEEDRLREKDVAQLATNTATGIAGTLS
jgi:hypothetical protein